MSDISEINKTLLEKGYRSSPIRDAILKVLTTFSKPLSAGDIIELLEKNNLFPNKTTVYRETDKLLDESIIKEIDLLDGKKRYELNKNDHHHHVICRACGKVECVDMENDLDFMEKQIEKSTKFKIESHTLEFFGICEKCAV